MFLRKFFIPIIAILVLTASCGKKVESNKKEPKSDTTKKESKKPVKLTPDSVANLNGKNATVVPSMKSDLQDQNTVHCSNVEYLWNEVKKITDQKIESNQVIKELNESKTWKNTLKLDKLILALGSPDKVYEEILKQYKEKYNIDKKDLTKKGTTFWGYSFKFINYKYAEPFIPLRFNFGKDRVNGFGFDGYPGSMDTKRHFSSQYEILYFNFKGEYIVRLIPAETTDQIVLVMTAKKGNFKELYDYSQNLIEKGDSERKKSKSNYILNDVDELKIPIIRFNTVKQYSELLGLKFSSKYGTIEEFDQIIKFNFDEKGVVMESEVSMTDSLGGKITPKLLLYNRPFYLYIKEEKASYPYFNLWVENSGILEKEN
jgi:hypothetical protein